ncbi:MAG: hypothetical protein ACRDBY_14405 [Cetobacterium sp.]
MKIVYTKTIEDILNFVTRVEEAHKKHIKMSDGECEGKIVIEDRTFSYRSSGMVTYEISVGYLFKANECAREDLEELLFVLRAEEPEVNKDNRKLVEEELVKRFSLLKSYIEQEIKEHTKILQVILQ